MDRKTLLAVVISVVIIVAGMLITPLISPPKTDCRSGPDGTGCSAARRARRRQPAAAAAAPSGQAAGTQAATQKPGTAPAAVAASGQVQALADSAPPASQTATVVRETDLYTLTFKSAGATLSSVQLKKYKNVDGSPVEMLLLPPAGLAGRDAVRPLLRRLHRRAGQRAVHPERVQHGEQCRRTTSPGRFFRRRGCPSRCTRPTCSTRTSTSSSCASPSRTR